jgi:O-antigen ligase
MSAMTVDVRETPVDRITTLAELLLAACLFARLVGFSLPAAGVQVTDAAGPSKDALTILVFGGSAVMGALLTHARRGLSMPTVPGSLLLLLAWCTLSLTWSAVPQTGLVRLVQTVVAPLVFVMLVDVVGWRRSLEILRTVLVVMVILDYGAVALFEGGRHMSNEIDVNLVGAWKGFHTHKNVAGGLYAITCIVLWDHMRRNGRTLDVVAFLAALGFMTMGWSKTSLLAVGACILAYEGAPYVASRTARIPLAIAAVVAGLSLAFTAFAYRQDVVEYATEADRFTGRGQLWDIMVEYAGDNLWQGSGFGSFWRIGTEGPSYMHGAGWSALSYNGHNGYLETLATTGLPGLTLLVIALVAAPFALAIHLCASRNPMGPILMGVVSFLTIVNFSESVFLMGSAPSWGLFACLLAIGWNARTEIEETQDHA